MTKSPAASIATVELLANPDVVVLTSVSEPTGDVPDRNWRCSSRSTTQGTAVRRRL